MHLRSPRVGQLSTLLVLALGSAALAAPPAPKPAPRPAAAKATPEKMPDDIFPLAKIRPGMKGYGLTVFKGTKPERFDFEVIGILSKFLPDQDVVLVRSDDPKLALSGFAQGMSGSPMMIEGKNAGAFAYAFRFSKESIGAFTPIETMIKQGRTPPRGPNLTALASRDEWKQHGLDSFIAGRDRAASASERDQAWAVRAPLPPVPTAPRGPDQRLERASVPLSVAGFSPKALAEATRMFSPLGLEPMTGGGGSAPDEGPTAFEAGGSIGVQLVRGDMSAVGTGTVTYVDGKSRVLGFGHSMFQMGEIYVPVVTATIHAFMASSMISFKLSTPNREVGTLVQDRQAMIAALTDRKTDMIPVDVRITGAGPQPVDWHTEVVRHRFLTPTFVMMSVFSAIGVHATDVAAQTITMKSTLVLDGFAPLTFTDYAFAPDGVSGGSIGAARALRILTPLLFNPYAPVTIKSVKVDVDVAYKSDYIEIDQISIDEAEVTAGKPTVARVTVLPYGGARYDIPITFTVPKRLAGQIVRIEVAQGDIVRPEMAPPENLPELIEVLRKGTYPGNAMVLTVWNPDEGVTLKGKVIADLPDSVIDSLKPGTSTRRAEPFRSAARVVVPTGKVIDGRIDLSVKVKPLDSDEETK